MRIKSVQMFVTTCRLLLCVTGIGCDGASTAQHPPDVGPTYSQPEGTGPQTVNGVDYEYVADTERAVRVTMSFVMLSPGMAREDVREAVGFPDVVRPLKHTDSEGKWSFVGWLYEYDVVVHKQPKQIYGLGWLRAPAPPIPPDKRVMVYFDADGCVVWAEAEELLWPMAGEPDRVLLEAASEGS